jgi:hypothetical protein
MEELVELTDISARYISSVLSELKNVQKFPDIEKDCRKKVYVYAG